MTTEFKDPHAWFIVKSDDGDTQTVYNNETKDNNYPFAFEVNFSDQPTPAQNTVTLYNMSAKHRSFYKKKQKCQLCFNWGSSKKVLCQGYLSQIGVNQSDGTTENVVITYTEGTDYKNVEARKLKVANKKRLISILPSRRKFPVNGSKNGFITTQRRMAKRLDIISIKEFIKKRLTRRSGLNIKPPKPLWLI